MTDKLQRNKFVNGIVDLLKSKGAVPGTHGVGILGFTYDWELNTPNGLMYFTVEGYTDKGDLGVVFGRFDNVESGKRFNANPYSGKWNHHYFHGWLVPLAVEDFKSKLERVFNE